MNVKKLTWKYVLSNMVRPRSLAKKIQKIMLRVYQAKWSKIHWNWYKNIAVANLYGYCKKENEYVQIFELFLFLSK